MLRYAIILLSGILFLFAACEQDEEMPGSGGAILAPPAGEPVTVNFSVGERDHGNYPVVVRNTTPLPSTKSLSFSEELAGNSVPVPNPLSSLYLFASMIEDNAPVGLRALRLEEDTKVRVVAYDIFSVPNDTIKLAHADYVADGGGSLVPHGTPPMTVPSGSILFVAWSFNDTITLPAFDETVAAIGPHDLLWGDTLVTVGPGHTNVHILLDHLFSKIKLEAQADFPSPAPNMIDAIFGAHYDHTFPTLTVQSGNLTPGVGGQIPFDWQASGSAPIWPSKDHYVYTNGDPPVVAIDGVTIDETPYTGPWTVNYTTPLAVGHNYTLYAGFTPPYLNVSPDSLFFEFNATGNIYSPNVQTVTVSTNIAGGWSFSVGGSDVSNFQAIQLNDQLLVIPTWTNMTGSTLRTITITVTAGGLTQTVNVTQDTGNGSHRIVIRGSGPDTRLELTQEFSYDAALFQYGRILGWNYNNTGAANYNPTGDSALSTWNSNWGLASGEITHSYHHTPGRLASGGGDPCRLVGYTVAYIESEIQAGRTPDNGMWRMNLWTEYITSSNTSRVNWNTVNGFNGHYFPTSATSPYWLPAAGYRNANGQYSDRGTLGCYRSTRNQLGGTSNYMRFTNTTIDLTSFLSPPSIYAAAIAVRCVRQ